MKKLEGEYAFGNTTTLPQGVLEWLKGSSVTLVLPNTIDFVDGLKNPEMVRTLVEQGNLIFHAWKPSWKTQWDKDMFSSAIQQLVPAGKVLEMIPNAEHLGAIIDEVAIPLEKWLNPKWSFPGFNEDQLAEIGLTSSANRTQVFVACDKLSRDDIKSQYDHWYACRLASQHGCSYYLGVDFTLVQVD